MYTYVYIYIYIAKQKDVKINIKNPDIFLAPSGHYLDSYPPPMDIYNCFLSVCVTVTVLHFTCYLFYNLVILFFS